MRDAIDIMQKPFTKPGVRLYLLPGVYSSVVRVRVCSVSFNSVFVPFACVLLNDWTLNGLL